MAIWHFDIAIVPVKGLVKIHGVIPEMLCEYREMTIDVDLSSISSHNYWEGFSLLDDMPDEVQQILPEVYSRSPKELGIGSRDGNRFTIWRDELLFEFDVSDPDLEVLDAVLRLARKWDCKLVVGKLGAVIEPEMLPVLEAVKESGAFKFVTDPQRWLREISLRNKR